MQEVIRSIIEKLEELQKINYEAYETVTWNNDKIAYINASNAYSNAIDIVKQEAEQYNNDLCEWTSAGDFMDNAEYQSTMQS